MIVNSRIFIRPGHVVGTPAETRIDLKVDHFPWSNCTTKELGQLIAKLEGIHKLAIAPRFNNELTPSEAEPE